MEPKITNLSSFGNSILTEYCQTQDQKRKKYIQVIEYS